MRGVEGLYYIKYQSFSPVSWGRGWEEPIQTTGQKLWYSIWYNPFTERREIVAVSARGGG